MFIKKLFTIFCAMLLSLTIIPLNGVWTLNTNAALQAVWPVEPEFTEITTKFDENRNTGGLYGGHNGIDIPADANSDIYAPIDGVCVSSGWMGDYGNLIVLLHENLGIYTFYAHCTKSAVTAGQEVKAGDVIGYVGCTGNSYGNHLHFGICDKLLGGYPTAIYYDPLTYFTYSIEQNPDNSTPPVEPDVPDEPDVPVEPDAPSNTPEPDKCDCSEEYAGIYEPYNITSYLNVRSGHGSYFALVGQLYPENRVEVTKGNGEWAHIKYGDISGYCSMEYLKRVDEKAPSMTISNPLIPPQTVTKGNPVNLGGTIKSAYIITCFTGGIYKADGETPVYEFKKSPNALIYSLSGEFDNSMLFNKLDIGSYVYRVEAEDENGDVYTLIDAAFDVVQPVVKGDINGDGSVSISDGVLMQKYILGTEALNSVQLECADLSDDSIVNIFDMIMFRKQISAII